MNQRPAARLTPNRPASPTPAQPTDPFGRASLWRGAVGYLALALLLLAAGVWLWQSGPAQPQAGMAAPASAASAATSAPPATLAIASHASANPASPPAAGTARPQPAPPPVVDGQDPTRDLSSYVMRGQNPTAAQVIERLHQAGIHSGLGAFSPPGTRPPLIGLAVPDDFVLPEGYVRHHQATDDGQRIEAILMFAPDKRLFDANGRPIPVPANRVVPPEYAPPGLPIRRIVLPKPIDPGRP